jgi:histidyl-tRNA synthetase
MTEEKGLEEAVADKIGEYVQRKGGADLLKELQQDAALSGNASAKKGMDDLDLLFQYLKAFGSLEHVSFDLSLARGLDYYTGVIFEVVTEGSAPKQGKRPPKKASTNPDEDRSHDPSVGVGSVAAGGRYDELVGMFSGKSQIPCVGISFGVDRIFSIIKARMEADKSSLVRSNEVDVFVMAFGGKGFTGMLSERMEVCRLLWDAGIKVGYNYWFLRDKMLIFNARLNFLIKSSPSCQLNSRQQKMEVCRLQLF